MKIEVKPLSNQQPMQVRQWNTQLRWGTFDRKYDQHSPLGNDIWISATIRMQDILYLILIRRWDKMLTLTASCLLKCNCKNQREFPKLIVVLDSNKKTYALW